MDTQNVVSFTNSHGAVARARWILGTAVGMAGVDLKYFTSYLIEQEAPLSPTD